MLWLLFRREIRYKLHSWEQISPATHSLPILSVQSHHTSSAPHLLPITSFFDSFPNFSGRSPLRSIFFLLVEHPFHWFPIISLFRYMKPKQALMSDILPGGPQVVSLAASPFCWASLVTLYPEHSKPASSVQGLLLLLPSLGCPAQTSTSQVLLRWPVLQETALWALKTFTVPAFLFSQLYYLSPPAIPSCCVCICSYHPTQKPGLQLEAFSLTQIHRS